MAIPLRGRTSSEIAKALHDHLITQHGPPTTILSDRGRELISKAMQHLCKYWGVRKVATGGYNPTGNAFCERFHRYLNSAITTLKPGSADSPEWDRLVPAVLFSYRCSINDATGFSPYYLLHGKDPHMPEDLLFQASEKKLEFVADYVDTIQANLRSAFKLARSQQYAAAIGNKERAHEKFRPNYKLGDKLYVWEVSSIDAMVQNSETNNFTKLPKKWTNKWSGPFDFIEWISERSCTVNYYGKPTLYPANRLSLHTPWDTVNPDTNAWCLQNRKGEPGSMASVPMKTTDKDPPPIAADYVLKTDELFVFPMDISEENLLPFGMGKVIHHKPGQFINFQWMSNFNQNQLAKFLPMWFQPSDKKSYYKAKPTSPGHPPYTGKDVGVFIKIEDLILVSGDTAFLEEDIIKPWALKFILQNDLVKQAIQDFDSRRKTPNL
jgi:transposase InsO family protein